MIKALDYFASLVQDDEQIPLFEAALSIAQDDDPGLDMTACQLEIDKLAARLRRRSSSARRPRSTCSGLQAPDHSILPSSIQ